MHETALSRSNGMEKFFEFFLRVRGNPNDDIDHKKKKKKKNRYVLQFDFLIWSLKVWIWTFFATYKLIKRLLPSKRHGEINLIFPQG